MRIDASLRIYCGESFGVVSLSNTKENGLDASPFTAQGTFKNFFQINPISSGVTEQREAPGGGTKCPHRLILVN